MRYVLLLLALSTSALADLFPASDPSPIITAPIHVSGTGFYDAEPIGLYGGWYLGLQLNGTEGADSVSLQATGGFDMGGLAAIPDPIANTNFGPFGVPTTEYYTGSATIDGIMGEFPFNLPNYATFSFSNGGGSIKIIDGNGALLAEADIIGYIQITSEVDKYGSFPLLVSHTAFSKPITLSTSSRRRNPLRSSSWERC